MGIFDDLIPEQNQKAASSGGGFFDDLIPSKPPEEGAGATSAPKVSARPQGRPARGVDETDDARSDRSFGNSTYDDGLVDRPDVMVPQNPLGTVDDQLTRMRRREKVTEEEAGQSVADLGSRFSRGATEVAASLPEGAAVAGFGNKNASALLAHEEVQRAREQIQLAEQRLAENPGLSAEAKQRIADVVATERRKIESYEPLIATADGPLKPDAQDRELFKSGDRIRAASEEIFGTPDPQFDDRFISKLSEGAGSMAGFVAATLFTGVGGGAVTGSSLNASGMYRRARHEGASEDQARAAAYLGAVVGASEVVPIGRALDLLPAKSRGRVANALGRRLTDAFLSAGEEGAQEAMTEIANNMIARGIWNPEQDILEGAGEAALIGAVLGGGLGAITSSPRDDERLSSPRLTDADRASALPNAVIDDGKAAIEEMLTGVTPPDVLAKQQSGPNTQSSVPTSPPIPSSSTAPVAPVAPQRPDALNAAPDAPTAPDETLIPVVGEDGKETGDFVRFNEETGQVERAQPQKVDAPSPEAPPSVPAESQPEAISDGARAEPKTQAEFDREIEIAAARRLRARAANTDLDLTDEARRAMIESAEEIERHYGVSPPVEVKTRRPGPATLQKRPLAQEIKSRELAVKPGSPLAKELNARGINTRTHPGLFRSTGVSDWDNLPAGEWQDYRHELGEDGNGYLNQQGLIDALESEMRGEPVQVGDQAHLQAAADAEEALARFEAAEPDSEALDLSEADGVQIYIPSPDEDISDPYQRFDMVRRGVDAILNEVGLSDVFTDAERTEAVSHLEKQGGNVEDIIWWQIHRSAEANAEPTTEPRLASGSDDAAPARGIRPVQEVSEDRTGQQLDAGTEAGSTAPNQENRRPDERQAEETRTSDAPEVTSPARVPSFEDLRQALPKDSEGYPDVIGAGQAALDAAAGEKGAQWANLSDDQKRAAFTDAGGDLAGLSQADSKPTGADVAQERPQDAQQAPQEPVASPKPPKHLKALRRVAQGAIGKADVDLNADRNTNTARRARMAGGAIADAIARKRNAETALRIADVVEADPSSPLASIKSIKDIERADQFLRQAQYKRIRAEGGRVDKAGPPSVEDIPAIEKPRLFLRLGEISDLLDHTKGMKGVPRRELQRLQGRNDDGFLYVSGKDASNVAEALRIGKKKPLGYSLKNLGDEIRDYQARTRMFGDDPRAFFEAYLEQRSGIVVKKDPVKEARVALIGNKIPGFFETPEALAERMVDLADLKPGDKVLEPSGGGGRIANALAAVVGKENVDVLEVNGSLRELLELQGFELKGSDFMEFDGADYDAVVMNPPFESRQDADHVQRAYEKLKPGGRLVTIMGEGVFFGSDKRATSFRDWLDQEAGESEQLPAGTFKESGTGTNTRLVQITKAAMEDVAPVGRAAEIATTETTEAGEQSVIPGAEQSAERSAEARKGDERREVDARQKQSRSGTTVPQDDAGPLFDTQGDMFDAPRDAPSKTQARLTEILGKAWRAREDLPDTDHDEFIAQTAKVREARKAIEEEFGNDAAETALQEIEAEYFGEKKTPSPKPLQTDAKPGQRIEDFGEVLQGAQKHLARDWADRANNVPDDDLANHPLSKSWPEPNYDELIKGGTDPEAVAFIHAARDEVPNKPRKGIKQNRWAEQVRSLREMASRLATGEYTMDQIKEKAKADLEGMLGRVALYQAVGHEKSLKGIRLSSSSYSLRDGVKYDPPKVFWTVSKRAKATAFSNWPREFVVAESRAEAIAKFKAAYDGLDLGDKSSGKGSVKFEIRQWRSSKQVFIGKKIGKNWVELKTFEDVKAAREFRDQNHAALLKMLEAYKATPFERSVDNAARLGVDHRAGQDATPELFQEEFGFRGVQFGNYVEGPRRQADLNEAYDALMDLAGVIGIPPKAISLNGSLGLAFGARGKGGKNAAAAHYEPDSIVINLTKKSGAGSLAHEWWHGLDNYFSRARGNNAGYISDQPYFRGEGVRPEVTDQFKAVMKAIHATNLKIRSSELDKRRTKEYWSTPIEMSARSFESYVIGKLQDQGGANDYLANVLSKEAWDALEALQGHEGKPTYPYITASEMPAIRGAFDSLFEVIQTEDTDQGVRMYQAAAAVARGHAPARREASTFAEAKAGVKAFQGETLINRDSGIEAVVSRNALDKMLSSKAVNKSDSPATHSLVVANVDSLFENAIYGWKKPDMKGQSGVAGMHRLFARLDRDDGSAVFTKLTVKQTEREGQSNPLYTVEAVEFLGEGTSAATWVMSAFRSDGNGPKINPPAEAAIDLAIEVEKINAQGPRVDMQVLEDLMPALQARLDKLMIRGVDLRLAPDMLEQGATEFSPEGITILIGNTLDGVHTVNHEAIHVLKARGIFKDAEWAALSAQAEQEWIQKYDIEGRYPDLDRVAQVEEAVAEAFADHVDGTPSRGKIANIFAKLKRFFRAMREALLGQGIRSPEDIFAAVDAGEVGARGLDVDATGETRHQRPSSKVRKLKPEGVQATAVASHSSAIPDDTRFEVFRRTVQDRMLILRRMREVTEKDTGKKISKENDPYFAEERYSGRVGDRLEDIDANYTQPIIDLIAKAPKTIKVTDQKGEVREGAEATSLWLMARHAKERNAHIASINDRMPDGGSGLTNAEADAILKSAAAYQPTLDQIGDLTDKLGQQMITIREDAGLLSAKDALIWRRMYKHYVPLQKFAEDDMFDGVVNDRGTAMGRKFNVRGKEQQAAMGRSTEAFDPLATLLTQAMEVAVRAEKNAVAKVMYNFAVFNPNPSMYEISAPETQRYFDQATGKVETRVVGPAARQLAENEMALKVSGKEYRITFNDPRLAEALGQLGTNEMGKVTSIASVFSRYFSSINTMLSPSFIAINALRDMMTAQVNLGEAGGAISGKLRKAAMRDYIKALKGSYRAMSKHKHDTEYSKWFKEYSESGGKVHFWKVENPEGQSVDFRKRVKRASRGKVLGTVSSLALPSTRDNPALNMIENVNLAVDNAVRLATYVEARKNGWSKADAASLSKNLTVNFNRRGEIGATMNAWYPFANAAIQGSHVILKAMKSRNVLKIVGGMILFGFLNDLLAATLSGTDEDGELEYDQLPAYKSERNIIVATPFGDEKYVTIPLPYGYNVFFFAGQQLGKITRGVKSPSEASGQMLMATIGAFSPISGETGFTMVAPTILDFANEFDNNEDWLGRPIRPENPYGDYGPQSYKEFNASGISRMAARGMNTATGGSPLEPGLIDVSPEYIDHFFKFMTGGAGRFVGKTYGLAERAVEGTLDQTEAYEVPIARSFITESGDFLNQNRYFEFRDAVREARAQQKLSVEGGHPMTQEMRDLNNLWVHLRAAEKRRKEVSGQIDGVYSNTTYSNREREQRLRPLKERRNKVYIDFNRRFISAMGPQAE